MASFVNILVTKFLKRLKGFEIEDGILVCNDMDIKKERFKQELLTLNKESYVE